MKNKDACLLPMKLFRKYGTRDPFRLACELGIHVMKRDDFDRQKGAFSVVLNVPFIFINDNLSEEMQRIVCAHELGHAMLHRRLCKQRKNQTIYELEIFDIKDNTEYEANVFAAGLLIDEEELTEYIQQGYDIVQMAKALDVNINLLMIKIIEMHDRTDSPMNLPFIPKRNFLGTIEDSAESI